MQTKIPRFQLAHLGSVICSVYIQAQERVQLTLISLAIRTYFVSLQFQEALDRSCVLCSALLRRVRLSSRHDVLQGLMWIQEK